jgi:ATP-dependent RNA helicase DDX31/DBP7
VETIPEQGKDSVEDVENKDATFTLPERLKQHFVMVPCKLRLVTLAAFILAKSKVGFCVGEGVQGIMMW